MISRFSKFLLFSLFILALSGCTTSGKKLTKSQIDKGFKLPSSFRINGSGELYSDRWWEIFKNNELNSLMNKMLLNNFQLAKSYEGLRALQATLGISEADKLPSLEAGIEATEGYSTSSGKRAWRDDYKISFTASYEVDLWGRISASIESDRLALLSDSYNMETLYMTLSAELADRYFLYKSFVSVLKLQKDKLELRRKKISLLELMYSNGIGTLDTIYVEQTSIADLQKSITETKQSMESALFEIAQLTGETDLSQIKLINTVEFDVKIPHLPSVVPSVVVSQRPDIKASYATVLQIDRDVAGAMADRYPQLSFSASVSYSGDELSRLITPENFISNLVANLVTPLFDAGKLKLEVQKQKHLLSQQIYDYYETVITALTEMNTSLIENLEQEKALNLNIEKVLIETNRFKIANMKYEIGIDDEDYSDVIDSEISLIAEQINEVNSRQELVSSRIELSRVAGGTWAGDIVSFIKRCGD